MMWNESNKVDFLVSWQMYKGVHSCLILVTRNPEAKKVCDLQRFTWLALLTERTITSTYCAENVLNQLHKLRNKVGEDKLCGNQIV